MMALKAGARHVTAVDRWLYMALACKDSLVCASDLSMTFPALACRLEGMEQSTAQSPQSNNFNDWYHAWLAVKSAVDICTAQQITVSMRSASHGQHAVSGSERRATKQFQIFASPQDCQACKASDE